MKAWLNTKPHLLELQELPLPEPGPGQVRIRTACCGVCATDLQMIAGWARTGFPSTPGHEWSGTVDALGPNVPQAWLGARCVGENVLRDGGEVGFEHPGGYGEYLLTDAANLHRLPHDFPLDQAALIEPLAVCVRGLGRVQASGAASAVVFGDGVIGLLMTGLLTMGPSRCRVTVVGGRASRLALATAFGAAATVDYHAAGDGLAACVLDACGGRPSVVIEASGSPGACAAALASAAHDARVLVLGDYGTARAGFPWNHLLHHELTLVGSNASAGAWPEAVRLACGRALALDRLISGRVAADAGDRALERTRDDRRVVKLLIDWRPAGEPA